MNNTAGSKTFTSWIAEHRIILTWFVGAGVLAATLFTDVARPERLGYELLESLGYLLLGVGMAGRIWCGVYIAGRKNRELAQEGPYSICRNPLYLFSFIGLVGYCFGAKNLPLLAVLVPVFMVYYHFTIRWEEENLRDVFGEAYAAYQAKVPKVLPRFSIYRTSTELTVNPKKISRAILEAFWFLTGISFLELVEYAKSLQAQGLLHWPVLFRLPF